MKRKERKGANDDGTARRIIIQKWHRHPSVFKFSSAAFRSSRKTSQEKGEGFLFDVFHVLRIARSAIFLET